MARTIDKVRSGWLVTGRWIGVLAALATMFYGLRASPHTALVLEGSGVIAVIASSNLWLLARARSTAEIRVRTAGVIVCADVLMFSWLLSRAGGALNPTATFYPVEIVLAALVLGRGWAWTVSSLAAASYAIVFARPGDELRAAQVMHPGIALHMQGMWLALAGTAGAIAFLATRFTALAERRDAEVTALRDLAARHARAHSLATAVAGAAHELSSPLATMAVAARELESALSDRQADADLLGDAQLIRSQVSRCRDILDQMAGRFSGPVGQAPVATSLDAVVASAIRAAGDGAGARVRPAITGQAAVRWPAHVVEAALANLIRNALQASSGDVAIDATLEGRLAHIAVSDAGCGMAPAVLAHAEEPFFTTRTEGMGLGLYVARSTVESLGGRLTLTSREGHGTRATLSLPLDVTQAAE
jgi:two-component system sensor histidine kinase RegB